MLMEHLILAPDRVQDANNLVLRRFRSSAQCWRDASDRVAGRRTERGRLAAVVGLLRWRSGWARQPRGLTAGRPWLAVGQLWKAVGPSARLARPRAPERQQWPSGSPGRRWGRRQWRLQWPLPTAARVLACQVFPRREPGRCRLAAWCQAAEALCHQWAGRQRCV